MQQQTPPVLAKTQPNDNGAAAKDAKSSVNPENVSKQRPPRSGGLVRSKSG
jgi:hypothetical protein